MKSRAISALGLSVVLLTGGISISTAQTAQPLRNNYICASPPGCTGGFQSSADRDVGRVMLHFSVADGTPNGSYGWAYTVDGTSGGNYSVTVQNGVVTTGQDWIVWTTPSYFWGPNIIGVVTVTGGEHVYVPSSTSAGFYPVEGYHDCCCNYGCTSTTTYTQVIQVNIGEGAPDANLTRECDANTGCATCSTEPMASYSMHLMLASLHIEDTPISYNSPRGPSPEFKVTYNQREANQPATFTYANLGSKWTFNWLSYVTDDGPTVTAVTPTVYVRGGGTEALGGFNSTTQSYAPDRQTLAVLVRTSNDTYERRFSDGSKEVFGQPDGSSFSPRRVFLTSVIDRVGNATTLSYDASFRVTVITDPLGQSTTLSYDLANDALKITKVTDPFGRSAIFEYTSSKLTRITDPIGIQSAFNYATGSDFINSMTTPYGTTTFASGESGNSVRWIEVTDPRGGRERVEYNSAAPNIASTEPSAPPGVYNTSLQFRNSFYWDKKAMADAPGDYTKAELFHWLITPEGKISAIKHSEKKPLENRVWYIYAEQSDPGKVGRTAQPIDVARVVDGGGVQLFQYNYNPLGNLVKETDPVGRVKTYVYDGNNIDLLEVYQRNPNGSSLDPDGQHADRIASFTYNSLHEPLTEMDAAGQVMRSSYNSAGQILTRTNPRNEMTTYTYEGIAPLGYLHSITGPSFNGSSAVTSFTYDPYRRIQTITNEADEATVTIEYDNLDRRTKIIYSDNTYEQFHYTDTDAGIMTLDLTESRDRTGKWTYRHYDSNRKLESITDPLGHTTRYGWCVCGALTSITDPNRNVTTFNRDLQGRVYQKVFSDSATVDYLFEGQNGPNTAGATSRLKSATDALNRRTNYSYFNDDRISQIYYTDSSGNPLNPPTHSVEYTYDISYNRIESMADETGITTYSYYPIGSSPTLGAGRLATIDGPLGDDLIRFDFDELGRLVSRSINGVTETAAYDSLGRLERTRNVLGEFIREYDGVTPRLRKMIERGGVKSSYNYFGNEHARRLQTIQNVNPGGANLSRFDYDYDAGGQITSWRKLLGTAESTFWFDYDAGEQLVSARNASNPSGATQRYDYGYDEAGNRMLDFEYDPRLFGGGSWLAGRFVTYTSNGLNELDSRTVQVNNEPPNISSLSYDLVGNLTNDGERMTFEWDAANRLLAVNYTGTSKRSEFTYDGLNRRVKIIEKESGVIVSTKRFVWIGTQIAQERDANSAITRRYFAEGEERIGVDGEGENYYYTRDHLGSIREVMSSKGEPLARYDYDPYGNRTILPSKMEVDFGYGGHYHHGPSGLNLPLYRAYSPVLGRWISRDPIGEKGGMNLYEDVQNDPINRIDPLGLFGFRYYGNWGGPGWTGGQTRPYEELTPLEITNLAPPIDAQDRCYMQHDICYSQCRTKNQCTAKANPTKDQRRQENTCEANCDYYLAECLRNVERPNFHSGLGWSFFTWKFTVR